jgi:hypothetical protein
MPISLNERNPENRDGDWAKLFAAFSISMALFVAVVVVATRYPSAGKWIADVVQAEYTATSAPSADNTAEPPRDVAQAGKIK